MLSCFFVTRPVQGEGMDCAPETTLPRPQLLVISNNVSCMLDLATNSPIHFVRGGPKREAANRQQRAKKEHASGHQ